MEHGFETSCDKSPKGAAGQEAGQEFLKNLFE